MVASREQNQTRVRRLIVPVSLVGAVFLGILVLGKSAQIRVSRVSPDPPEVGGELLVHVSVLSLPSFAQELRWRWTESPNWRLVQNGIILIPACPPGKFEIEVQALGPFGVVIAHRTVELEAVNAEPSVEIVSTEPPQPVVNEPFRINFRVHSPVKRNALIKVRVPPHWSWQTLNGTSVDLPAIPENQNELSIEFKAFDEKGFQSGVQRRHWKVVSPKPWVEALVESEDGKLYAGEACRIVFRSHSPVPRRSVAVEWRPTPEATWQRLPANRLEIPVVPADWSTLEFRAVDDQGYSSEIKQIPVIIPRPQVSLVSPRNGEKLIAGRVITFEFNARSPKGRPVDIEYRFDNAPWQRSPGDRLAYHVPPTDKLTLHYRAVDATGIASEVLSQVWPIEIPYPTIAIKELSPARNLQPMRPLRISFSARSPEDRPLVIYYRIAGQKNWQRLAGTDLVLERLLPGRWTMEFFAEDSHGIRSRVETVSWTVSRLLREYQHPEGVLTGLVLLPHGRLVTSSRQWWANAPAGMLCLWDLRSWNKLTSRELKWPPDAPTCLTILGDKRIVAFGCRGGFGSSSLIRLRSVDTLGYLADVDLPSEYPIVHLTAAASAAFLAASDGHKVWLWRVIGSDKPRLVAEWKYPSRSVGSISSLGMSEYGTWVIAGANLGTVIVWKRGHEQPQAVLHRHNMPCTGVAIAEDGSLAVSSDGTKLVLWDINGSRAIGELSLWPGWVRTFVVTRGFNFLIAGGEDGILRIVDLRCMSLYEQMLAHSNGVSKLFLSEEDGLLVSATADGEIRLWHVADLVGPSDQ